MACVSTQLKENIYCVHTARRIRPVHKQILHVAMEAKDRSGSQFKHDHRYMKILDCQDI